jgi:hypothetical protein
MQLGCRRIAAMENKQSLHRSRMDGVLVEEDQDTGASLPRRADFIVQITASYSLVTIMRSALLKSLWFQPLPVGIEKGGDEQERQDEEQQVGQAVDAAHKENRKGKRDQQKGRKPYNRSLPGERQQE